MDRLASAPIKHDLDEKIVLLSGPRQVGKTTLSKNLFQDFDYFNYDDPSDRITLKLRAWDRQKPLVIFDEIHKMKEWKRWIKGVYDKEGVRPRLLVTGSARMDIARKMGDSLAGRFHLHRLYPLDIKEMAGQMSGEE